MNAKFKAAYEAPAMRVVDLQVKASLCIVSKQSIDWSYKDDIFSPDDLKGWGLPGYGDAIDI